MKKSLITTLVAVPLLSLSSLTFAAEPLELTASQMDNVTAGYLSFKYAAIKQWNASPVTTAQVSVLTLGGNTSVVNSGNTAVIAQ